MLAVAGAAESPKIQELTPQMVVDAILTKSFEAENIRLKAQEAYVIKEEGLAKYDFNLTANAGYRYDEAETLSGLDNPIDKTFTAGMTFKKKISTGTEILIGYDHWAQSSVLNPIVASTRTPRLASDYAFLELRQSLWRNAFGISDRADLSILRAQFANSNLVKQEDTENLVLSAMRAFWNAYVAQTQLQDAIKARQQYKDLISLVQRRGRFGLDKGGEYAEVMAEYTDADSRVKSASQAYLQEIKNLEVWMGVEFDGDVQFKAGDTLPPLPKLTEVKIENLRRIRISESRMQQATDNLRMGKWQSKAKLDLVARAGTTGVDEKATTAYSEFVSGNKPDYFVGLEFATAIDSSAARAVEARSRVNYDRESNNLRLARLDVARDLILKATQMEGAFAVANSAIESEKYRSRTAREKEVEYRQGRLPLRELLKTYKDYFDSQSRKVRAIGDYHIALNDMAAERDELVK